MDDAEGRFQVAVALLGQGDREAAHGALLACVAGDDPEWSPRASALVTLGVIRARQGDVAAAEKACRDVIA
ncbi:tetratricopeptide repeat protein [Jiangella alba]|uniref:tetratricopeptide repeat protein n=1 Tax=Jiangella alba TaxID=561176 RepID=UPI00083F2F30|nr:hypothetical protein [Jiangella alba]